MKHIYLELLYCVNTKELCYKTYRPTVINRTSKWSNIWNETNDRTNMHLNPCLMFTPSR